MPWYPIDDLMKTFPGHSSSSMIILQILKYGCESQLWRRRHSVPNTNPFSLLTDNLCEQDRANFISKIILKPGTRNWFWGSLT